MKPTQEQVIAWAREAGGDDWGLFRDFMPEIERLATLAYEAGQESMKWDGIHSCHPDCQRPACVHTRKAVEAERDAIAEMVRNCDPRATPKGIAAAIRARGGGRDD